MFVPATPGGELARQLQEGEDKDKLGTKERRIKFVEIGGETVKDMLCRNNPWGKYKCGRDECMICPEAKDNQGGECRQEGAVYRIQCVICSRMLGGDS